MVVLTSPPFSSFVVGNKLSLDTLHAHCATARILWKHSFLCSNESPSLFVDDLLQTWTMVKLVLMQIVADADVAVGFFLAQPRTRCWTLSEEDTRCNGHLEFDADWWLVSAGSDDHVS